MYINVDARVDQSQQKEFTVIGPGEYGVGDFEYGYSISGEFEDGEFVFDEDAGMYWCEAIGHLLTYDENHNPIHPNDVDWANIDDTPLLEKIEEKERYVEQEAAEEEQVAEQKALFESPFDEKRPIKLRRRIP